jgi:putative transposase
MTLDKQESIRGTQYTSIRYTTRLADAGAVASIGSVGDSYDCEHWGVAAVAI